MKIALVFIPFFLLAIPAAPVVGQSIRNDQVDTLDSGIGGQWGDWTRTVYCPPGTWASGYTMRVEPEQGRGDDTSLNAIALYCSDRQGREVGRLSPHPGFWGNWVEGARCAPGAFLTHFQLKVEPPQGSGDDTAANSVAFFCNASRQRIEASGGRWGRFGDWRGGFPNAAICGVQAKVEREQGRGDDTALNDLAFTWCRI